MLELVVVANALNTVTLLVPPAVAVDVPTSKLLVGRVTVVLGAGGSARRLIWVSAPIESRIKEFTPGVRLILPPRPGRTD